MKAWQFQVSVILGALSLILAFAVIKTGKTSQKLQNDLQSQQNEINTGLLSQMVISIPNQKLIPSPTPMAITQRSTRLRNSSRWSPKLIKILLSSSPSLI